MVRSSLLITWMSILWVCWSGHSVLAEMVTLTPTKDNTLFDTGGTTSNGSGDSVFSGRTGLNAGQIKQRAVLQFEVAGSIPVDAVITAAQLTLTLLSSGANGDQVHVLHRLLNDWGEGASAGMGGSGAPAAPGDATWLHTFFPDQFWKNQGGDFDAAASASQVVGTVQLTTYTWGPTPEMTADVQSWLDNPADNFGWLVRGNEELLNTAKRFASREHPVTNIRPVLTVEFTPPCPADLTGDGAVDGSDLPLLLGVWGECPEECPADLNEDGAVNPFDLALLLGAWGPC